MLCDVLTNIFSDFLTIILLAIISWVILYLTRRNRLLKFFGIKKSRRIVFYLSNLSVQPFGAKGIDGHVRSYSGSAGAYKEILAANSFRELFNYFIPSLSDSPGILSKLLISDVQVQILLSPMIEGEIEKGTSIITFGSSAYNRVSDYVESKLHTKVKIKPGVINRKTLWGEDFGDNIPLYLPSSGSSAGWKGTAETHTDRHITDTAAYSSTASPAPSDEAIQEDIKSEIIIEGMPSINNLDTGFVLRVLDKKNDRQIFYVAGLTEESTASAAYFLQNRWIYLHKKYKKDDFLVMLRFDKPGDRHPTILFEC